MFLRRTGTLSSNYYYEYDPIRNTTARHESPGYAITDKTKEDNISTKKQEPQSAMIKGWVCPICGRALSPYMMICPYHVRSLTL